jgi:hypothetical protein
MKIVDGAVHLPAKTREVRLTYSQNSSAQVNFERTVASYKREYRRRYEELVSTGEMSTGPDSWRVPE